VYPTMSARNTPARCTPVFSPASSPTTEQHLPPGCQPWQTICRTRAETKLLQDGAVEGVGVAFVALKREEDRGMVLRSIAYYIYI
jgi:hypothetical protein